VRVPKGNVNLLPIPDDVPDEKALYLSDILPTSYHAVVDTGVQEGDVVGVWGLGPIGLCVARWAQLKGAKRIIGIDRIPERLALARSALGIETLDFSEHKDVTAEMAKRVPGGLDVAIDAGTFHQPKSKLHKVQKALKLETDVPETLNECIVCTRKFGRVGIIAVYASITNQFNIGAVMEKGIRLIGNGQAPVHLYWEEILNDYVRTGKFDTSLYVPPSSARTDTYTRAAFLPTACVSRRWTSCTTPSTSARAASTRCSSRRGSRRRPLPVRRRSGRSRSGRRTSERTQPTIEHIVLHICIIYTDVGDIYVVHIY
jgi:threonine dehydrogenase-like Zn-dependent dehydrogenase